MNPGSCAEHSGIVQGIKHLSEVVEKAEKRIDKAETDIAEKFEQLKDSIVNMKLETARKSARVGVTWGGIFVGGYEVVKWMIENAHAIKIFFTTGG